MDENSLSDDTTNSTKESHVSIGMPVYNGELFLQNTINSLLSQTFENFELIISDNASTDNTEKICQEYVKKDKRVSYFRHSQPIGALPNFHFVLDKAKNDFFMWNAADDLRDEKFLEKMVKILNEDKKNVGSMSKAEFYHGVEKNIKKTHKQNSGNNFLLKMRYLLKPGDLLSLEGPYDKKVKLFLKKSRTWLFYGLFRTEELRKSWINDELIGIGVIVIINILKYGNIRIVDETLTYFYDGGSSKKGIIHLSKLFDLRLLEKIFLYYPLTVNCRKSLGNKIFLKNIGYFIQLNLWGFLTLIIDLIQQNVISLKSKK